MEYANTGDLLHYLTDLRVRPLPEPLVWKFFFDILLGIQHLHHVGIVHRDLKVENILLHTYLGPEGTPQLKAMISDFGTSLPLDTSRGVQNSGVTGAFIFVVAFPFA